MGARIDVLVSEVTDCVPSACSPAHSKGRSDPRSLVTFLPPADSTSSWVHLPYMVLIGTPSFFCRLKNFQSSRLAPNHCAAFEASVCLANLTPASHHHPNRRRKGLRDRATIQARPLTPIQFPFPFPYGDI